MKPELKDKKIAVLMTHGVEESEYEEPVKALTKHGATVDIISLKKEKIRTWKNKDWSSEVPADYAIDEVEAADYDALVLPGGVMNPDSLRANEAAVKFVKGFMGKPIAAICHGPWTLIDADLVQGQTMTSYPSLKTDLLNAGANWVDKEVAVSGRIVTSRNPGDLPAFCEKMLQTFATPTPEWVD